MRTSHRRDGHRFPAIRTLPHDFLPEKCRLSARRLPGGSIISCHTRATRHSVRGIAISFSFRTAFRGGLPQSTGRRFSPFQSRVPVALQTVFKVGIAVRDRNASSSHRSASSDGIKAILQDGYQGKTTGEQVRNRSRLFRADGLQWIDASGPPCWNVAGQPGSGNEK